MAEPVKKRKKNKEKSEKEVQKVSEKSRRTSADFFTIEQRFLLMTRYSNSPTHKRESLFNVLHLNISMHILYAVFYTFPKVMARRICLKIKSLHSGDLNV